MLKRAGALGGALIILGLLVVAPAFAGVPKVEVIEEFGATW